MLDLTMKVGVWRCHLCNTNDKKIVTFSGFLGDGVFGLLRRGTGCNRGFSRLLILCLPLDGRHCLGSRPERCLWTLGVGSRLVPSRGVSADAEHGRRDAARAGNEA